MCQKKRRKKSFLKKWEKLWKKSWKISFVFVHKCWKFHQLHNQIAIHPLVQIFLGFDCNTFILSILLVCIKSEISLRMCLIHLHRSYLIVSTRHWTSSLDYDLALQYLEFKLSSLWIIPHQAPHISHRNWYADLVFA